MIESASARYNAEQMAKTVQSRIETNKTSQSSFENFDTKTMFSRDPNKKNSVFIGNMTWVSDPFCYNNISIFDLYELNCSDIILNQYNCSVMYWFSIKSD